jgi:hypothetical protein
MKILRAGGWFSLSAVLVLGASSCEGKDDVSEISGYQRPDPNVNDATGESRCVPGQTSACVGVCNGLALGYQVCAADGRSYAECICPPDASIGSVGAIEPGSATVIPPRLGPRGVDPLGTSGGPINGIALIGAACEASGGCGAGLDCLPEETDSFGVGGPAGGYCTMPCNDSADCTALDRTSTCGVIAGRSFCLRTCQSQDPAEGENKCLERPDLTCVSLAASGDEEPTEAPQFGICAPSCQSDESCGDRRCDLAAGLCRNEPRAGDIIGASCSEPAACAAGLCLGAQVGSPGICSAFCTIGFPGCGYDGSEALIGAACLLSQVPGEGEGDRGLCFALCELDEDCAGEGFVCVPDPSAAENGRGGACVPPAFVAPVEPEEPAEPEVPSEPSEPEPEEPVEADAGIVASDSGAPQCLVDADCGEQVCDVIAGSCIAPPPAPVGAACTEDTECLGDGASAEDTRLCLGLGGSTLCSAACLLGTPLGCEAYGTDAFCILPAQEDIGFCLELCNTPDECEQLGYDCVAIGIDINGRNGACLPPEPPAAPDTP